MLFQAVHHYTMAIRLSLHPSAVLHSNRAAAFAGAGVFRRSLEDAGMPNASVVEGGRLEIWLGWGCNVKLM